MHAKSGIWMGVRKEKKKITIVVLCQQRVKRSGVTGKDAQNSDRWRSKLGGRNANMNFCDVLHACIGWRRFSTYCMYMYCIETWSLTLKEEY